MELDPDDAGAHWSRGSAYLQKDDPDRAIQDFDRALELDPYDGRFLYSRGVSLLTLSEWAKSRTDLSATAKSGFSIALEFSD